MSKGPRKVAVIGFGSQGRAWAKQLRAAGDHVTVGLRTRSKSRAAATRLGFAVATPVQAVTASEAIAILVPDQAGRKVLTELLPHTRTDGLVVLAAGYPMVFPSPLKTRRDLVLVAPHGPGRDLEAGHAMSGFVAVGHDASGKAMTRARAFARRLGLHPLFDTTPRSEALGDLFGEQALLCGGLLGLTAEVASLMVQHGVPASHAWYETVGQLERLSRLLAEQGVGGFWREISDCAAAGAARADRRLFRPEFARALASVWDDVESGRFARSFQGRGRPRAYPARWEILARMEKARAVAKKKG